MLIFFFFLYTLEHSHAKHSLSSALKEKKEKGIKQYLHDVWWNNRAQSPRLCVPSSSTTTLPLYWCQRFVVFVTVFFLFLLLSLDISGICHWNCATKSPKSISFSQFSMNFNAICLKSWKCSFQNTFYNKYDYAQLWKFISFSSLAESRRSPKNAFTSVIRYLYARYMPCVRIRKKKPKNRWRVKIKMEKQKQKKRGSSGINVVVRRRWRNEQEKHDPFWQMRTSAAASVSNKNEMCSTDGAVVDCCMYICTSTDRTHAPIDGAHTMHSSRTAAHTVTHMEYTRCNKCASTSERMTCMQHVQQQRLVVCD